MICYINKLYNLYIIYPLKFELNELVIYIYHMFDHFLMDILCHWKCSTAPHDAARAHQCDLSLRGNSGSQGWNQQQPIRLCYYYQYL